MSSFRCILNISHISVKHIQNETFTHADLHKHIHAHRDTHTYRNVDRLTQPYRSTKTHSSQKHKSIKQLFKRSSNIL